MNNDKRILELKNKLEEKRAKCTVPTSDYKTNLIFEFMGFKGNLNVMSYSELYWMHRFLLSLRFAANPPDKNEPVISGFALGDWIRDFSTKIRTYEYKEQRKELDKLEKELDALLSSDKRTELKIDSIEKILS